MFCYSISCINVKLCIKQETSEVYAYSDRGEAEVIFYVAIEPN